VLTSAPFSYRLRAATTQDHREAETSAFMTAVMQGRIEPATYAGLVVQLQEIYGGLDGAAARYRAEPAYGPFFDPRLDRGEALRQDRGHLGGEGHEVTGATRAYTQRLTAAAPDPLLVLAHHYTRYLGDLSGGRAIAAKLQQNLGLSPDAGLAFYQFDIGPAPAYKNAYRLRLDELELTADEEQQFIAEVQAAYTLNRGVFASLDHLL
jgi:heme oxygenase